jgi:hypothetical protein
MTTDRDPLDRDPADLDFSKGIRGKYVDRLGGPDAAWVLEMTAKDTHLWVAESLRHFQSLEAWLVAYFALGFDLPPQEAGRAMLDALENPRSPHYETLLRDLEAVADSNLNPGVRDQLRQVFAERNWLVHRSFLYERKHNAVELTNRMTRAAEAASQARDTLRTLVLLKCKSAGIPHQDALQRAGAVIREWAAA